MSLAYASLFNFASADSAFTQSDVFRTRLIYTTTSSCSQFMLDSGGRILYKPKLTTIEGTPATGDPTFDWDKQLIQVNPTAAGSTIKVQADLVLSGLNPSVPLTFKGVKCGDGQTTFEFYNYNGSSPELTAFATLTQTTNGTMTFSALSSNGFTTGGPPANSRVETRQVIAFYHWYDYHNWSDSQLIDSPLITYTNITADSTARLRHIQQTSQVNIDTLAMVWGGHSGSNPYTDVQFGTMLDEMTDSGTGIKGAALLEDNLENFITQAKLVSELQYFLNSYSNKPAYLKHNGKPVIFIYNPTNFPKESGQTSAQAWKSIISQVNIPAIWIAGALQYDDNAWWDTFDGVMCYGCYVTKLQGNIERTTQLTADRVRSYNLLDDLTASRKLFVGDAIPGFDETHLNRPENSRKMDRNNGETYRASFDLVFNAPADWLSITSFNEWWENTHIEPGQNYGSDYLDLTQELGAKFKTASTPFPTNVPTATTPSTTATPTVSPTSSFDYFTYLPIIIKK
jgi:hypothetical protein